MTAWRSAAPVVELCRSATWDGARAEATVVVATCNRKAWLRDLLHALAQQVGPALEVVLVDDGSTDGTPEVLAALAVTTLPLLVLRLPERSGPSAARNGGVDRARTPYLLLTDDDCLPEPEWSASLLRGLVAGASVVQGRTTPVDEEHGPWDRAITVRGISGLYETCNLGLLADPFRSAGGFADLGLLPGLSARGFGEDAELGSRVCDAGHAVWAETAVVRHRWIPSTYVDHLAGRRRLVGFPRLATLVPEVADRLTYGVFLSPRSFHTDAAVAATGLALLARRRWPLLAALPWCLQLLEEAAGRPGRPRAVRAAQLGLADLVGAAALARGSIRARRAVL